MIIRGYGSNYEIYDGESWYFVNITADDLEYWWPDVAFDNVDEAIADYRISLREVLSEELDLEDDDLEEAVDRIASSVSLILSDIWASANDDGHYFFVERMDNGDYCEAPLNAATQKEACDEASMMWHYLTAQERNHRAEVFVMRSDVDKDGNPTDDGGDIILYFKGGR